MAAMTERRRPRGPYRRIVVRLCRGTAVLAAEEPMSALSFLSLSAFGSTPPCPGLSLRPAHGRIPKVGFFVLTLIAGAFFAQDAAAGFVTARSESAGVDPLSAAVGDFNGDGIPDVAVLDYDTAPGHACSVSVLLGNGDS